MYSGVFSGVGGALRLLTLLIGIIDFGLTVDSYTHHYRNEEYFLSVVIVLLVLSCILAMLGFLQLGKVHKVDIVYHIIGAALLFVGGILMLYSVFWVGWTYSKWYYARRITSGILGLINSIVYGFLGWVLMYK